MQNDLTTTRSSWRHMLDRCRNPNCANYSYYGGRGISVCGRWFVFENFLADMGIAPPGTSLDRIDNDDDYKPENCRWATKKEQSRNTRSSRMIEFDGRTQSMASWAEEYGISADTVWARLDRGWEVGDALRVPVNKHETIVEYGGLGMPLTAWAERMGINRATLKSRLALGWSISDALETPVHQKDR